MRVEAAPLAAVVSVRAAYKWLARHRAGGDDNRITTTSLTTRTMVAVPNLGWISIILSLSHHCRLSNLAHGVVYRLETSRDEPTW
jgi:hypothetical protein